MLGTSFSQIRTWAWWIPGRTNRRASVREDGWLANKVAEMEWFVTVTYRLILDHRCRVKEVWSQFCSFTSVSRWRLQNRWAKISNFTRHTWWESVNLLTRSMTIVSSNSSFMSSSWPRDDIITSSKMGSASSSIKPRLTGVKQKVAACINARLSFSLVKHDTFTKPRLRKPCLHSLSHALVAAWLDVVHACPVLSGHLLHLLLTKPRHLHLRTVNTQEVLSWAALLLHPQAVCVCVFSHSLMHVVVLRSRFWVWVW